MLKKALVSCAVAAAAMTFGAGSAQASSSYVQDFSANNDTSGWITQGSKSTITWNSGDASSDGAYAVVTNTPDDYQTGYGDSGYTYFGGESTTYTGSFTQSVDIYIDADYWVAPNPNSAAFWLDMAPASTAGGSDYAAENNFNFFFDGSDNVNVAATGAGDANSFATITSSGWYTFAMTFSKGASGVQTELTVANQGGGLIGSATTYAADNNLGYDPSNSLLGFGGYAWLTVWQNGFASDSLPIDNLKLTAADAVPVPATLPAGLTLLGLCGLGLVIHRRRRLA